MSNEVILVGGSKDGLVTEGVYGLQAVHNIVLNDTKDGPAYIDRYVPAKVEDKEGRPVYVHVGRYNAEESKTYWDRLDPQDVADLVAAAEAEEAEEAKRVEEENAKAEEAAKTEQASTEEAPAEEEKPAEEVEAPAEQEAPVEEEKPAEA
jgi:hypothetical protein